MQFIDALLSGLGHLIAAAIIVLSVYIPMLRPVEVPAIPMAPEPAATGTPADFPQAAAVATTTPKKAVVAAPAKEVVTVPAAAAPAAPAIPKTPALSDADLNTKARASLVNVYCTTLSGGSTAPISGSGVIVDSRGVILTNAHVAQYFLLRDYLAKGNVDCVIRTGSPAQPRYRAQLLYLPTAWVNANAQEITTNAPTGTGQDDFAFLLITGTTDPAGTLPASFPAITLELGEPAVGESTLLAAYPAGFLSGQIITTNLYAASAYAYVTKLFSFDGSANVDLFSIGGTVVSQAGSSGGAVVTRQGSLTGIISTATLDSAQTGGRDLRAITPNYINRALATVGKGGLEGFLGGDAAAQAAAFNRDVFPVLKAKLEAALNAH